MSDDRYWRSLEEYEGQAIEDRGEFHASPLRDESKDEGLDHPSRRDFLKVMGASFAMMGTAACTRRPTEAIVPYVKRPEDVMPGVSNWYASTCRECESACGILVRTREGRPVKFEGNPSHPTSQGALCARGQASVLNVYDPDRLQAPLKSARKGLGHTLTWEALDGEVVGKLREIQAKGGKIRVLTGELGPSTEKLVSEFVAGFPDASHVTFELLGNEEIAAASELSYGQRVVPRYLLRKAEMLVSFGADFLGSWYSPVEFSQDFAKNRKVGGNATEGREKKMSRFVAFEALLTTAGANADERIRLKSGDEYKAALALAYELIVAGKRSKLAADSAVVKALEPFAPAQIAPHLGVAPEVFSRVASELWQNRGRSLVLGGGTTVKGDLGLGLELAVNLLNSALENEGVTVDGSAQPSTHRSSYASLTKLVAELKAGEVDALLIYGANPIYNLPPAFGFAEAFAKAGLVVQFSSTLDETGRAADYVCATPHHAEAWGDASPYSGVYSIQQPTIAPLYQTRDFEETLLVWAKQLKLQGKLAAAGGWHKYLKANWESSIYPRGEKPFAIFWEELLREGVYLRREGAPRPRAFRSASLAKLPKLSWTRDLTLALYAKVGILDGRNANNGWLQELPDPISRITWDNYACLSPALAKELKVKEGDVVRVRTGLVSLEFPAHIQPGLHDKSIAVAVGYGRESAGRVGNGVGVNAFPFVVAEASGFAFSGFVMNPEKTAKHQDLANTQGHHTLEGRPIVREASLTKYAKDPHVTGESHEPPPTLWKEWNYPGYRWAMAIDLNSCTGCGACVVACQAENNVPIVGKKFALAHKEMHWLRIDRYYSGRLEEPKVAFQPMLCQHCENAPCETVCPVLAALHSSEGLNQQVYNRCVGTRYCENNCPYKVRRFNWFTFTEVAKPMNLQFNPDVTVRTRGVMEKCTFCVQRITEAKDHAKNLNRKVQDGELRTACQQTCPTEAISFGDIKDEKTRVHRLSKDPRGYHVLKELNVRPSITYLTKIRNTET